MYIQRREIGHAPVGTIERGFYTEADIAEIVKKSIQEAMLAYVVEDEHPIDNSESNPASSKKLTVSVQEAANMLGISKPKMFELLNSGQIPHKRIGKKIIISYQAVADWVYQ